MARQATSLLHFTFIIAAQIQRHTVKEMYTGQAVVLHMCLPLCIFQRAVPVWTYREEAHGEGGGWYADVCWMNLSRLPVLTVGTVGLPLGSPSEEDREAVQVLGSKLSASRLSRTMSSLQKDARPCAHHVSLKCSRTCSYHQVPGTNWTLGVPRGLDMLGASWPCEYIKQDGTA